MFTSIEALNYRCLCYVRQSLGPFHVLVGPNASGKTTFLDVIAFLADLVSHGIDEALERRTQNFQDLLFGRQGTHFELAIEAQIPEFLVLQSSRPEPYRYVRYEVSIGTEPGMPETSEVVFRHECVKLSRFTHIIDRQKLLFPDPDTAPQTIIQSGAKKGTRTIVKKVSGGNDNFYSEVYEGAGKGWAPAFKLGPRKSALANLPEDESKFPVATWFKQLLADGVQQIILDSLEMRRASRPGQSGIFKTDGSNLPWVIENLRDKDPRRFEDWLAHLRTALPDLVGLKTIERREDRHRYLMLCYEGGLEVPSWTASDGTLRLMALTLPAYLPDFRGVFLIEEPENGIHPRAVETMFASLSNVYSAQVLMATHSPVVLSCANAQQVLCFAKGADGATDIVSGDAHPDLVDWQESTNLGELFAAGVLG